MGWWTDIAVKHPGTPNQGGAMYEQRGLVVHIAEGSYDGTISWIMNPASEVSSHFVVAKDGRITQMVDTDRIAWTQADGNGHWLSVENEGHTPSALTDAQLSANARILRKAHQVYGCPLTIATCPTDRGLGHHSMGAECGANWGHSECPGPNIKAQKPEIVARAQGEEDDVSAKDVWAYDVDPSQSGTYTGGGALWTTFGRTDYLANQFAPAVMAKLTAIEAASSTTGPVAAPTPTLMSAPPPPAAPVDGHERIYLIMVVLVLAILVGADIVARFTT